MKVFWVIRSVYSYFQVQKYVFYMLLSNFFSFFFMEEKMIFLSNSIIYCTFATEIK